MFQMLQHSKSPNCPLPLVDGRGVMDLAQVDREGSWWQELVWLYSGSSSWSVVVVMGMMACALHGGSVVLRIF